MSKENIIIRYTVESPHYREDFYAEYINKEDKNKLIKGVVQKIIVNPQFGLTSFTIKGQDGFFSIGKDKPTFSEGQAIQFETNQVGKYTYAKDIAPWTDGGISQGESVARVANAAPNRSFGGKGRSFGGGASAKDEYWAAKEARDIAKEGEYALTQRRIEIQAARNAAIEAAKAMIQFDLVPDGAAKIKQKDKYDHFLGLVNQLTDTFLGDTAVRLGDLERQGEADVEGPSEAAGQTTPAANTAWD